MTTVIHVHDMQEGDVYIGRKSTLSSPMRSDSPWRSDFKISAILPRDEAIKAYEYWVLYSVEHRAMWIREHVHELKGKRLACWCAPKPCHGNSLAKWAENGVS